jgi:hypothetical protein
MFLDKIRESLIDFANLANRPEKILLSREQQPNPLSDDRERITSARQAAEALFKPNSTRQDATGTGDRARRPSGTEAACSANRLTAGVGSAHRA